VSPSDESSYFEIVSFDTLENFRLLIRRQSTDHPSDRRRLEPRDMNVHEMRIKATCTRSSARQTILRPVLVAGFYPRCEIGLQVMKHFECSCLAEWFHGFDWSAASLPA